MSSDVKVPAADVKTAEAADGGFDAVANPCIELGLAGLARTGFLMTSLFSSRSRAFANAASKLSPTLASHSTDASTEECLLSAACACLAENPRSCN